MESNRAGTVPKSSRLPRTQSTFTRQSYLMTSLPLPSRRGIRTRSWKLYLRRLLCCISSLFTLRTSHAVRRPCSPSNRELPNSWISAELQQSTIFRKVGALLVGHLSYVTQLFALPGGQRSRSTPSPLCRPPVPWRCVSSTDFIPIKCMPNSALSQKQ